MKTYLFLCGYCGHCWSAYFTEMECKQCGNLHIKGKEAEIPTPASLLEMWIEIGKCNSWIADACDPRFDENSFAEMQTIGELKEKLMHGNWCLGQAFYYNDLCFINQVNGGDEWLVIKGTIAFESFTCMPMIKSGEFDKSVNRIFRATPYELRHLKY